MQLGTCLWEQLAATSLHVVLTYSSTPYLWYRHFAEVATFEAWSAVNKRHVVFMTHKQMHVEQA
jgi:hypothetical protein